MQQPSLDLTSRIRIAGLLYKLAIRMQKVSKRPIEPGKAAMRINVTTDGALSKLAAHFTPAVGAKKGTSPGLVKVLAHRTFVPGHGGGIRVDLFFGPMHLVETVEGLGILTSKSERDQLGGGYSGLETVDTLESLFPAKLGGLSHSMRVITADAREHSDRRFGIERDFKDGKRVWKIMDTETGKPAYYQLPASLAQEAETDPYREAIFTSAQDATRVLNELTRGTSHKSRTLPKFKEYTVFVKYSAVYLENHPATDVGASLYEVLNPLIPMEAEERAEEMERRMQKEVELHEKRTQSKIRREEEGAQTERQKLFDVARRRR